MVINEETKNNIINFQTPKSVKQVQAFLGLVNWDRRFIPNLSKYTEPMESLLKKGEKFKWTSDQAKAFEEIKQKFKEAKQLFLARSDAQFILETDAPTIGLGARLIQKPPDREEQTVAYVSRKLRPAEKKYTATEKEALAIVWALKKWRILLLGRRIITRTDHRALQFLKTCVFSSERVAGWLEFLQEFDLEIEYIPGKDNKIADTLSRIAVGLNNKKINLQIANFQTKDTGKISRMVGAEKLGFINDKMKDWVRILRVAQQHDEELIKLKNL